MARHINHRFSALRVRDPFLRTGQAVFHATECFVFTPQMRKRLTRRAVLMLEESIRLFPELRGTTITVGYTRTKDGVALIPTEAGVPLHIRLKVRGLSYNTIGHELTHLMQGVTRLKKRGSEPDSTSIIPGGETQCDIWTLARSELFCDEAPVYVQMPGRVRDHWADYASEVRRLCIQAIQKRKTYRHYIKWLESKIAGLAGPRGENASSARQLSFPFAEGDAPMGSVLKGTAP